MAHTSIMKLPLLQTFLVLSLFFFAHGKVFTVTTNFVLPDANPGDGICRTIANTCSLRAAIEEANARPQHDWVVIPGGTFPTTKNVGDLGLEIRESITITGAGSTLSGMNRGRHFQIRNEKLLVGLGGNGEIGAFRPSSGKRLPSVVRPGHVSSLVGSILVSGNVLYASFFTKGVARYTLRKRTAIESSASKFTYDFDRIVVNTNGNGAGRTTPTTLALASNGDLLVNSFQPTAFGIRRFDKTSFAYKGIFINPPGIINTMVKSGNLIYATLVGKGKVHAYNAVTGSLVKKSTSTFRTPRSIVLCSRRIFVAEEKNNRVVELNKDLKFVRTIVQDFGRLKSPQGLACFSSGELFVGTKDRKLLQYKYGPTTSSFVRDLTISGTFIGALGTIVNRDHFGGPRVVIRNMVLRDGRVNTGSSGPSIFVARGCNVFVSRCTIRKNRGSIFGGAITNSGTLTVFRTRLVDNTMPESTLSGGGVTNSGGAIGNFGKITIRRSEIANNQAARGGGLWNSGSEGSASIILSTISNNFAGNAGGGIYNTRFVEIKYSTIVENRCGKFTGDPANRRAGCGFYSFRNPATPGSFVTISSSIIAKNVQILKFGKIAPDCLAESPFSVRTFGGNIIGIVDTSLCKIFGSTTWDRRGSKLSPRDPGLGPLQFLSVKRPGLPPKTSRTRGHNPNSNSLAIKHNPFPSGLNPTDGCPFRDQIGRRKPQGDVCDVGAIERE